MTTTKLKLLRSPEGELVLLAAIHHKWAELIVRTASRISARHVLAADLAAYTPVAYAAPQDVLAERFMSSALGLRREVSSHVLALLARHGL